MKWWGGKDLGVFSRYGNVDEKWWGAGWNVAGNIIGRGGASQVYKGKTPDGKLVAVKCLNQGGGHQAEEELLTDIQITCNLSHVNIVKLLGYCADTPHMALVYDYVPQGSLDDHLHGKSITQKSIIINLASLGFINWELRSESESLIIMLLDHCT